MHTNNLGFINICLLKPNDEGLAFLENLLSAPTSTNVVDVIIIFLFLFGHYLVFQKPESRIYTELQLNT